MLQNIHLMQAWLKDLERALEVIEEFVHDVPCISNAGRLVRADRSSRAEFRQISGDWHEIYDRNDVFFGRSEFMKDKKKVLGRLIKKIDGGSPSG